MWNLFKTLEFAFFFSFLCLNLILMENDKVKKYIILLLPVLIYHCLNFKKEYDQYFKFHIFLEFFTEALKKLSQHSFNFNILYTIFFDSLNHDFI